MNNGAVELELIEVTRGGDGTLFDQHEGFTERWWGPSAAYAEAQFTYLHARCDGIDVARVKLDEVVYVEFYANTPALGKVALEIELLEVSETYRRHDIGTQVVRRLVERHPNRRLVAFSKDDDSDRFWGSLDWTSHEHLTKPGSKRLFIQPEGWAG